ncbi:MAG: patatin-like phospholipase family protein [Acidimicrobiia bacterium]
MTRAFVLTGGASEGAVQVGMLQALCDAGVEPDLVLGASVGAINGGVIAGRPGREGVEQLEGIWRGIRRSDVFPLTPVTGFLGFIGRRSHFIGNQALQRLISRNMAHDRLEDFPTRFVALATDLATGREVPLSAGPTVPALTASAAIPGIFPPVTVAGRALVDGSVANNSPVSHAVAMGADEVYVLPAGQVCERQDPPDSAIGSMLQALTLMLAQRLAIAIERFEQVVRLKVVPPPCPLDIPAIDFSQTNELIDRARETAREWLTTEPPRSGQAELAAPVKERPDDNAPQPPI